MAITRTQEISIADAWANDDDGITLEVGAGQTSITLDEAEEHAFAILNAVIEQRQTISARHTPPLDTTEPAL